MFYLATTLTSISSLTTLEHSFNSSSIFVNNNQNLHSWFVDVQVIFGILQICFFCILLWRACTVSGPVNRLTFILFFSFFAHVHFQYGSYALIWNWDPQCFRQCYYHCFNPMLNWSFGLRNKTQRVFYLFIHIIFLFLLFLFNC